MTELGDNLDVREACFLNGETDKNKLYNLKY